MSSGADLIPSGQVATRAAEAVCPDFPVAASRTEWFPPPYQLLPCHSRQQERDSSGCEGNISRPVRAGGLLLPKEWYNHIKLAQHSMSDLMTFNLQKQSWLAIVAHLPIHTFMFQFECQSEGRRVAVILTS